MLIFYYLFIQKFLNYYPKPSINKMFSKIKNMFTKTTLATQPPLSDTFDHSKIASGDASQCPFMSKNSKVQQKDAGKCPVSGKAADAGKKDSDSEEEEKPRGGCPFMGGSDKKKNPNLNLTQAGYNQPFVSKFRYYLSSNKLDFSAMKKGFTEPLSREVFDNYPIYLQHTLFYNGQDYKKVRNLQCCSRFMAYEELREKGNKKFNKGKYYEALDYYQRAVSLFKWLQYQEPSNEPKTNSELNILSENSIDQMSDTGSKVNIELGEQKEKSEDPNSAFDDLKSQYKQFFVTYCDDNVKLCDGEEMVDTPDLDMRKSLMVQLYLNMAAAYIHTHHYYLAEQACDDGILLSDKVSQLFFRKAQALSLRKDSTLQQLLRAQQLISKAIQMRPNEKIFTTASQGILKMLNLHDSAESYEACRQHVETRIKEVQGSKESNYELIYQRVKEINEIQKRMIEQGKTPRESTDDKVLYNTTQMKILERISRKYLRVMEFYTQAKNYEQISLAKKEFQQVLRVQSKVKEIFEVQLKQIEGQLGGIQTQKIQRRIAHVKTAFADNVYNEGKYNFTMLEWVIKQIVKEEAEEEKKKAEEEKLVNASQASQTSTVSSKGINKLVYLLLLIPLAFIFFNMYMV